MGFRKNRGCTDALFIIKQLAEKTIEHNRILYTTFIDQEKAFDRVNRDQLWDILPSYGVNQHLINLCKSLYINSNSTIRTSTGYSKFFNIKTGVKQGCVLSPLLFITYMDYICKLANPHEIDQSTLLITNNPSPTMKA